MTPEFPYVQLPGSYRGFFRKASLWEGADHILSVSGSRFNEEYRRFYYRDIQAIIVEKRARAGSLGWWLILLVLLAISIVAASQNDPPYSWVAALALALLVFIRLDLTLRRSCRCSIQTAVSREALPSLIRRTPAEAAIARLRLRIAAEQGDLPDEIPQSEEEVAGTVRAADPAAPPASAALAEADRRERRRAAGRGLNLAIVALFVLLLNSIFTFFVSSGGKQMSSITAAWAGYAFIAIGLIPICLSLQLIGRLNALKGLRILLVTMIVVSILRGALGLALLSLESALLSSQGRNFGLFQRYYVNTNGALQLALAAGGLLLVFAKWETYRRGEVSNN